MQNWQYTLYIPNDPRAVGICRRALRDILTSHHLPALVDPAQLLASELLGNAIQHTDGPAALKLSQSGYSVRLGAWDTDPTPPTPPMHRPVVSDDTGRGLHLVHAYADDWGWFRISGRQGDRAGKFVWCELGTEPD
ncbi:ATP-binding protein [Streptomyces blattellae]|uniref:ATP-binding protein n=1 Tax=Streptomyces blattellae TaxID=2569855 RepID=UPI0012B7AC1E|nr:ATP-binding protein [Streptomyces blattellae]